jgi:hypothetical protein
MRDMTAAELWIYSAFDGSMIHVASRTVLYYSGKLGTLYNMPKNRPLENGFEQIVQKRSSGATLEVVQDTKSSMIEKRPG